MASSLSNSGPRNQDPQTRILADKWAGHRCYIDGMSAVIVGRLNAFATVAPDNHYNHPGYEFSWHTVNRIMQRDRYFQA